MAPGARAPPCWIVLESFPKRETCFAGRIFRAWSGGPSRSTASNRKGVAPRAIILYYHEKASVSACAWSYAAIVGTINF